MGTETCVPCASPPPPGTPKGLPEMPTASASDTGRGSPCQGDTRANAGCSVPSTGREVQVEEEMGVPEVPSSPWKTAECTGGRRKVPGSAHPTLQPAGSTTCSPNPAQLLLPPLLCTVILFLSFGASLSCACSEKRIICGGEKRVWDCPGNVRRKC